MPFYPNFTSIVALTKSSKYGSLGPYVLTDKKVEFTRICGKPARFTKFVPPTTQYYSPYNRRMIWSHPFEQHVTISDAGTDFMRNITFGEGS